SSISRAVGSDRPGSPRPVTGSWRAGRRDAPPASRSRPGSTSPAVPTVLPHGSRSWAAERPRTTHPRRTANTLPWSRLRCSVKLRSRPGPDNSPHMTRWHSVGLHTVRPDRRGVRFMVAHRTPYPPVSLLRRARPTCQRSHVSPRNPLRNQRARNPGDRDQGRSLRPPHEFGPPAGGPTPVADGLTMVGNAWMSGPDRIRRGDLGRPAGATRYPAAGPRGLRPARYLGGLPPTSAQAA